MHAPRILLLLAALAAPLAAAEQLTGEDVTRILRQAIAAAAERDPQAVISIVDREGFVLAIWDVQGKAQPSAGIIAGAVSRAGTAAFLSSSQNAFTSRTAGFIIQQHFPPLVRGTPPGPLVGVGFSSLFYSDVNRFKSIPPGFDPLKLDGSDDPGNTVDAQTQKISPGARGGQVAFTSLNDSPGGVPLYKNGELVGGLGITGDGSPTDQSAAKAILDHETQRRATTGFKAGHDTDEDVALAGQSGFRPSEDILASNVLIGGIRIPYADPKPSDFPEPPSLQPLGSVGAPITGPQGSPPLFPYPPAVLQGVAGEIRQPIRADPLPGKINGRADRLTAEEVESIIGLAAKRCSEVRAGIRLPLGARAQTFISVVNNPHQNGIPPQVLGCFRVGEATIFSWDVSVQKARTAVFFSNRQLAMSCRTVGFLAQRFFPPGIDGQPWGPLFGFQEAVSLRTRPAPAPPGTFPGNPNLPNGLTIFPGSFPLYRHGELVGAIGVSGDGVDQDDIISASGCADFLPPKAIRADNFKYRGARLPYAKFPRDPEG